MLGTFCCEAVKKKQTELQVHWLVAYTASCFNIVLCPDPSWKNREGVRCCRTSCPPRYLVLGLDVPCQDGLSPPHNLATEFNVEVLVDHGEMELEYANHLYNYAAFSLIQPVLLRTNATLFDTSALSTFAQRMECSTTLHAEGSASKTKVYILSVYLGCRF